jgi:trans-aconitate methyltransferase
MWNPEDYAKNSDAQLKWARELRYRLPLTGTESVLDVGCGDGKITADFATALSLGKVVGVDSSPEMIAYAQKTYPTSQYPNLYFACIDARSLNFEEEFDLVFSNAALHWVNDHPAFLRGASRALKNNGRLIISCGGKGNAAGVLQIFSNLINQVPWAGYFASFSNPYFFYGTEEYESWLQDIGFKINRIELVSKDMTHAGKEGLSGWIRTTWMPFTQRVPETEREDFIASFVDAYLQKNPLDSDGLVHVQMVRLEIDAYIQKSKI